MEYGIQLYSVRDLAEKDFAAALEAVAKMGYTHVEFAGFFGIPAKEVKAMLDANGLKVSGTHSMLGELDGDFGALMDYHHTIGNTNYVCGLPKFDQKNLEISVEALNKYQPMLAAEGIRLGLHNHDREFRLNDAGLVVCGHEADELRLRADGGSNRFRGDEAGGVRGNEGDRAAGGFCRFKHAVMFDGGEHDMRPGKGAQHLIVGLRAAGGEDDFRCVAGEHPGKLPAAKAMDPPRLPGCAVCAGGVERRLPHALRHGIDDRLLGKGGRCVVQIDAFLHCRVLLLSR